MIGIAQVYDADIAITAEANGRCFFGDKISPLSDTTHIASLASGAPLFDHIRSMVYTTGPAAIIAGIIYIALSVYFSSGDDALGRPETLTQTIKL